MHAEPLVPDAASRLRRAFAGLVALERISRAFESLVIGACCAWILGGLARLQGAAVERAALAPAALAGLFAAASWMIEHWRGAREIAARADRVLATPQLLDTALGAAQRTPSGWSELLARRALARFDRTRLWLAAAPAWAASAALVLLAVGAHELCARWAPPEFPPAPLAQAWNSLAEGLQAGAPASAQPPGDARAELARELRAAAQLESRGELGAAQARGLLERSARELGAIGQSPSGGTPVPDTASAALAELGQAYGRAPRGSEPGSGAGQAGSPAAGAGSGVPSTSGEGTMGGSTGSGSARPPAPPGSAGVSGEGAFRPTLSARWWPRDQDGLVEAWIARQQSSRRTR